MENLERVQARLNRIRTIQPVLAALRTISLASWRMALRHRARIQPYCEHLAGIASRLPPSVLKEVPLRLDSCAADEERSYSLRLGLLVLGSERGLCGSHNTAVVGRAEEFLTRETTADTGVELMALGSRVARILEQREHALTWSRKLSLTTLPTYRLAEDLTRQWLARYESNELHRVYVVYSDYRGMGHYEPSVSQVIPAPPLGQESGPFDEVDPPPIIETDPVSLYRRLMEQWMAARLHEVLVASAASEHSTRYQLMDGASQNAERITGELTLAIHSARQQAITREMQELAAGAGLIGQRPS